MNNALNNIINEQVNEVFKQNAETMLNALSRPLDDSIESDHVQLVLNAVRLSMVYSIQLTMENLMALGVLSLDEHELQKAFLKYRSES